MRALSLYLIAILFEAGACGSVKATVPDASIDGAGPGPSIDSGGPAPIDGPLPDAPDAVNCDFAGVGSSCVFPPHIPVAALRACFGAAAPALDPPVGATLSFRKSGATYQVDCTPNCGGATTTIPAQEALFQASAPLIELFCLSSVNIPAGVTVTADPSFDRAISILASGAIAIGGTVDFSGAQPGDVPGGTGGPGGYAGGGRVAPFNGAGPCGGAGGVPQTSSTAPTGSGGGGGGHAGTGGGGGAGNPGIGGGAGGCSAPFGKLEGGSGGGAGGTGTVIAIGGTNFGSQFASSGGGGAVALVSRTSVAVTGTITANGAAGKVRTNNTSFNYDALGGTGGGAGGTIVLAGVTVNVSGSLRVDGGGGAIAWGNGGGGASGANVNGSGGANGPSSTNGGAGAGGGGGYVRVFAASGTANCATIASPVAGCASAPLAGAPAE